LIVRGHDLTESWLELAGELLLPGVEQLTHAVVTVSGFDQGFPDEHPAARALLDRALKKWGPCTAHETANTIFPESAWKLEAHRGMSPAAFFAHYHEKVMPKLAKQDARNRKGTYFGRMIAYPDGDKLLNQLQQLLGFWEGGVTRQSAYQVMTYHPGKDLSRSPYLGFPCLDHIAFTRDEEGLSVLATYASQLIFDRAYGNYLGLCRLARFMAAQMKIPFVQFTCVAACAKLTQSGGAGKKGATRGDLAKLVAAMRDTVAVDSVRKAA
jgi:hypothetical protein